MRPIRIKYFPSHEDFDEEEERPGRIRHPRDDLKDLKVEALKFEDNLNLENYLHWVQIMKMIFELKEYNDEKALKLAILKYKGYASLWYKHIKKNRAREAKSKIKT